MNLTQRQKEEKKSSLGNTLVELGKQKDMVALSITKVEETLMENYRIFILLHLEEGATSIQHILVMRGIQDMEKLVSFYEANMKEIQRLRLRALEEYHSL